MKQIQVRDYDLVHVEVTLGLRKEDGTQHTTKELTAYLQELNRQRVQSAEPRLSFKVFSGYSPYVLTGIDPMTIEHEVIENVALLHLDYNPAGVARERFETLTWYINNLMEHFGQPAAYAHFATDGGHRMLVFSRPEPSGKEETPA